MRADDQKWTVLAEGLEESERTRKALEVALANERAKVAALQAAIKGLEAKLKREGIK